MEPPGERGALQSPAATWEQIERFERAAARMTADIAWLVHARTNRGPFMVSREELKALRLKTMGMVGAHREQTAAMYQRVQDAGAKVDGARALAEAAYMEEISAQAADLKEMADELLEDAQSLPMKAAGTSGGVTQPPASTRPSAGSDALAALQTSQPGKMNLETPYDGTHPPGTEGPK